MSDDKSMYELHSVDEATGRHLPIMMGIAGDMRPGQVDREAVDKVLAIGREKGARPVEEFEDGRVQIGHYMYVPVGRSSAEGGN